MVKIAPAYVFRTYCETFVLTQRLHWTAELLDFFIISLDIVKFQVYLDAVVIDQFVYDLYPMIQERQQNLFEKRNTLHFFLSSMIVSVESFYQKKQPILGHPGAIYFIYVLCNYYDDVVEICRGTSLQVVFNNKYPDGLREYVISRYFYVNLNYWDLKKAREKDPVVDDFKWQLIRFAIRSLFYLYKDVRRNTGFYNYDVERMDIPHRPVKYDHTSGIIRWNLKEYYAGGINVTVDLKAVKFTVIEPKHFDFIGLIPYRLELEMYDVWAPEYRDHHFERGEYLVDVITDVLWKDNTVGVRKILDEDRYILNVGRTIYYNKPRYNNTRCCSMFDCKSQKKTLFDDSSELEELD